MTNDELKEKIDLLSKVIETQHLMLIKITANHHAGMALLRHYLCEQGHDRQTLNLQYDNAFRSQLSLFGDQVKAYLNTGDLNAFLDSPSFPDDIQGN